jgi:hypothetical protein
MPTPFSYKITVTEISEAPAVTASDANQSTGTYLHREIFSMAVPAADFDLPTFVQAINKRKRVRKARGKETQ